MFFRFLSLLVSCFFVSVLFRFFPSVFCFFFCCCCLFFCFVFFICFSFFFFFFLPFLSLFFFYAVQYVIFAGVFKSLPFGINGAKSGFLRTSGSFGIYQKTATRTK